jgi:hypothetical protein
VPVAVAERKAAMGAACNAKEGVNSMNRLITRSELTGRSESELAALFREVSLGLAQTAPGTPQRRDALASLENIARERAVRALRPRL